MRHSKLVVFLLVTVLALLPAFLSGGGTARGQAAPGDICGPIAATVVITENSRLVCDVECQTVTTPCIQFGRSGIKLSLNGFTMTGPAAPPNLQTCETTGTFQPADGIQAAGLADIVIEGPGVVQRFRRHGIALPGVTRTVVKKLVSNQNCFSGIWLVGGSTHTLIEEVVSVKNSAASSFFPCGGVCIAGAHDNRVRRSEFAGNGSVAPRTTEPFAACPVVGPNDFGVGLIGNSSGNIIEENGIGGNTNGVFVCPAATGNLIRKNVITGNPPIQVSADNPEQDPVGADVRDFGAASCSLDTTPESECPTAANRFHANLCLTYTGPNPSVCLRPALGATGMVPRVPQFSGHQNN
jgi:parallel beta-helix repeat protein